MDIPATLVLIIVAAALLAWMTNPRTGQALDAWASGFIGYRSYGWPRGVQEEDEVHFSFREPGHPALSGEVVSDVVDEAEIVELDGTPQEPIRVERLR